MKNNLGKKRVLVGLTGRAGSCVAAFLLKKQGFDVIGLSIVTSGKEDYKDAKSFPKCHITDLDKIKSFCDDIKIPFYATDGKGQYENDVIDPFFVNKLTGGANNSCFNCTRFRMDILFRKMKELKCSHFATGHFCKVNHNLTTDEYFIHAGEPNSDQSFLLSGVKQEYLTSLILPLGDLSQEDADKIASSFSLRSDKSRDGSTFCFRDKSTYLERIKAAIPTSLVFPGQIYDKERESVFGEHSGIMNHYITETDLDFKGLGHKDKELEIVGYDYRNGFIEIGLKKHLTFKGAQLIRLNFNRGVDRSAPLRCFLKNKYSRKYHLGILYFKTNNSAFMSFEEEIYPLISGENITIFDKNTKNAKVIGMAVIGDPGDFALIDKVDEFRKGEDAEIMFEEDEESVLNSMPSMFQF